jgi:hypothetical protein
MLPFCCPDPERPKNTTFFKFCVESDRYKQPNTKTIKKTPSDLCCGFIYRRIQPKKQQVIAQLHRMKTQKASGLADEKETGIN